MDELHRVRYEAGAQRFRGPSRHHTPQIDLSPKVTFLFLNLSKKKVQLFLIPAWAKETHFVLVKARQVFFF